MDYDAKNGRYNIRDLGKINIYDIVSVVDRDSTSLKVPSGTLTVKYFVPIYSEPIGSDPLIVDVCTEYQYTNPFTSRYYVEKTYTSQLLYNGNQLDNVEDIEIIIDVDFTHSIFNFILNKFGIMKSYDNTLDKFIIRYNSNASFNFDVMELELKKNSYVYKTLLKLKEDDKKEDGNLILGAGALVKYELNSINGAKLPSAEYSKYKYFDGTFEEIMKNIASEKSILNGSILKRITINF